MITKEDYEKQIEHYESVLVFQPNEKEKQKILDEIQVLRERIIFLINR